MGKRKRALKRKKKPLVEFYDISEGEPMFVHRGFFICCCDCGLRHHVTIEQLPKEVLALRFYRDDATTKIIRKAKKQK